MHQISTETLSVLICCIRFYKTRHDWVGKVIYCEFCTKFKFDNAKNGLSTTQHLSWRTRHKLLLNFDIQTDHLISTRLTDIVIINKKDRTCRTVGLTVSADHRVKLKESQKKDKYLDLAGELTKLWNMKVTIIPIVNNALGKVTKGLVKGLEDLEVGGRVETIQTTVLLRSARILRHEETCCHSISSEKLWANAGVKTPKRRNNYN